MKRKKNELKKGFNDGALIEIPVYGPHDTLGPQDYIIPDVLVAFENGFEQKCKDWLKNGEADMYNRGYMDMLIDRMEKKALAQLSVQRVGHESAVYELSKIWEGDRIKAEARMKEIALEKETMDQDIYKLEQIYHKGTAYEEDIVEVV